VLEKPIVEIAGLDKPNLTFNKLKPKQGRKPPGQRLNPARDKKGRNDCQEEK
jgi:hypothetical protein